MSPLEPRQEVVVQWMASARSDLAIAGITLPPEAMYEQLCFHAQQAAEKALKALLLSLGEATASPMTSKHWSNVAPGSGRAR